MAPLRRLSRACLRYQDSVVSRMELSVTVEVITVFFAFTLPILMYGTQHLVYSKLCQQQYSYNQTLVELCAHKSATGDIDFRPIEAETSLWIMYFNIALILPSVFSAVIQGAYIDQHGFKLPIRLTIAGTLVGFIFISFVASTELSHHYLFIGMIAISICGHATSFFMASNAYVACDSVDNPGNKSMRMAIIASCTYLAITVSLMLQGLIIDRLGVRWIFYFGSVSLFIALMDSIFRLGSPPVLMVHATNSSTSKPTFATILKTMLADYWRVLVKERTDCRRLHVHLMTTVFVLSFCARIGIMDIEFLYLTKEKSFTSLEFSLFTASSGFLSFLGAIIGVYVLHTKLKLNIIYIVLIGVLASVVVDVAWSVAETAAVFWAFNLLKLLTACVPVGARSFISDCVDYAEQGAIMSFVSVIESIFKLIATVVFNGIYPVTLYTWPGLVLVIAACLCLLGIPILVFIRCHEQALKEKTASLDRTSDESLLLEKEEDMSAH